VLICFDDIFPELARRFVRKGAELLLVITNDAWFGPTAAAYQHTQASTFRAIELRVPVARTANTGWSGCIDPSGRWIGRIHDATGTELFVEGTHTCDLPLGAAQTPLTRSGRMGIRSSQSLYLRWGDWFAGLCLVGTFSWLGLQLLTRR
jgi:apolipoprotein N-acyltransferase